MSASADVWITGLGAHSAAGAGGAALAAAMTSGAVLAAPSSLAHDRWVARAPDPALGHLGKRLSRSAAMFVSAAREAWSSTGLQGDEVAPDRVAVIEGSSLGPGADLLAAERERAAAGFPARVHPAQLFRMMLGGGSSAFAQEIGAEGPVFALSAGSSSGAMAIIEGWTKLRAGLVDVAVVGGAEAPIDPEVIATFLAAGILAPCGESVPCRPFDVSRNGTMLGEGSGVVVLELADHARRRGAVPLAVIRGVGIGGESGSLTAPDAEGHGVRRAAQGAMRNVSADSIGWIKAHGTATRLNDAAEVRGLAGLAPDAPITSLKAQLGHCLGASGALELVAAVVALRGGFIPATHGTTTVDPAFCGRRVALEPEALRRPGALLLSQSLGGRCAAVVVGE